MHHQLAFCAGATNLLSWFVPVSNIISYVSEFVVYLRVFWVEFCVVKRRMMNVFWQLFACKSNAVSTHAPQMGSDKYLLDTESVPVKFQSTLPRWGATRLLRCNLRRSSCFNPRSPCGERLVLGSTASLEYEFQPTLPMRGATAI